MSDSQIAPAQVQIVVPRDLLHGEYVNGALISHQPNEFVIDFYDVPPGAPQGEVLARMRVSPVLAKRLHDALGANLEKYEHNFGPILSAGAAPQAQVIFDTESAS